MTLLPVSHYTRVLRPHLPEGVFDPVPARLLWLALHVPVAVLGIWAIAAGGLAWPLKALISVPIGLAFAGMAFVAHEALHGAMVRARWARRLVGGIGFLPFLISPRHWVAWHNRLHHGNTMVPGVDPDSYPTLEVYRASVVTRVADRVSLGGRRLLGPLSLVIGLVVQSFEVLLSWGPRAGYLSRRQHRLALLETAAAVAVWAGVAAWLGLGTLLFGWLLPLALGGTVVMAHILTNHSLSSQTELNDPLVNSLSVTVPRWFSTYTLQFGLHVEHHMFPSVSGRHAPRIRELIQERWPESYRSLPLGGALRRMHVTGRVYKDAATLVDPLTGTESATL
jgi:fatty acid desaturase